METRQLSILRYTAVAVIAAVAGGALVYAFGGPGGKELNQLQMERDALKTEVSALTGRLGSLQSDVKSLHEKNTALDAEAGRLSATLAEKEKAVAKTAGDLADRQRAVTQIEKGARALKVEIDALKKQLAEKEKEVAKAAGDAADREHAVTQFEERARALRIENDALKKQLAGMSEKVDASAAEREALARKLGAAGRTLEEAQARAAVLNKSYESLLSEKATLAGRVAARRAELDTTKKALEDAQSEVARLMGARGIYTVQNGDSLSTIAAFFYRDGFRWPDIFKANSFLISHPDLIYPKQVLIIPQ